MFWIISAIVVVVLAALVWWVSGRSRPDLRRRSINEQIGMYQGRAGMHGAGFPRSDGPGPSGHAGF